MSAPRLPLVGRSCQDGGMRCWTCGQDGYTAAARLTNADTESWRKLRDRCSEVARP